MPYSKDPSVYPSEFADAFAQALDQPVEITCDYPQQAINMRHQLHAYRVAAESCKMPNAKRLREIQVTVVGNKLTLERSPIINKLREQLKTTAASEPTEEEIDRYLAKLESGEQNDS